MKIFNGVSDLQQLGTYVMGGFEQAQSGVLPQNLYADLSILTKTLAEGMAIEFNVLCQTDDDSPVVNAEKEMYMDMQRKYVDHIPGYQEAAGHFIFEDY